LAKYICTKPEKQAAESYRQIMARILSSASSRHTVLSAD
jgi:hypothetical protein